MKPDQLNAVWRWAGLLTLTVAFDIWSETQGGPALFGAAISQAENKSLMLILGLLAVSLLVLLTTSAGRRYATDRDIRPLPWHGRIPPTFFDSLDTRDPLARNMVCATLIIFLSVSISASIHFWLELSESLVRCGSTDDIHPLSLSAVRELVTLDDPCRIRDPGQISTDGVTWFPVVQPLIMAVIWLAALVQSARLVHGIFL